jgi:RNA polymerase sigma-70 factor (ECF subfamily)
VIKREGEWAEMMRAAIAGDAAAYRRLLSELTPVLRATARRGLSRTGRPVADAEDIVQETLLAIHLKRHTWDTGALIGPWISAIVRNKLIDALRRGNRSAALPIDDVSDFLATEDARSDEKAENVDRHVNTLPVRQRDVVRAIAMEGASIAEASQRLSMSEGAVRVALHRGLSTLAAKFGS